MNIKEQINNYIRRISILKIKLQRTDYYVIKYVEGELSSEEFEPIKVQRNSWRAEINELEDKINALRSK